jgi:hypothetical protein
MKEIFVVSSSKIKTGKLSHNFLSVVVGFASDCTIIVEKDLSAKNHKANPVEQPQGVPNKDIA